MEIKVQFFSQLKELAGASEKTLELRDGATVADLLAKLYRLHPELAKWERQILVGVGVEFVERSHVLRPNDEIAIMPPVQGG
ncbi:MAG: MoaD/ThiS family protein [Chthoniobacterales bacterium]|nr:MoaD/ThiS family protein [Chthoniobacterales bacterium]